MRGGLEFAPDPSARGARARLWVLRFMGTVGFVSLFGLVQARVMNRFKSEEWVWPAQRERLREERLAEARVIIDAQRIEAVKVAAAAADVVAAVAAATTTAKASKAANTSSCVIS